MCILTFWLSPSFLSLAHTCFHTMYTRSRVRVHYFYFIYLYFRPSLVACPRTFLSLPCPSIWRKQVLFIAAPVSALVLLSRRFFPIIAPPAFGSVFSSLLRPYFARPYCSSSSSSSRHLGFWVLFSKNSSRR